MGTQSGGRSEPYNGENAREHPSNPMANPTLTNYFGATLATLLDTNKAAIATDLGITQASVIDPDKMATAIIKKIRDWLIADGTNNPGISIQDFNAGAYTKSFDATNRAGQVGYEISLLIWQTDSNPSAPDPNSVV